MPGTSLPETRELSIFGLGFGRKVETERGSILLADSKRLPARTPFTHMPSLPPCPLSLCQRSIVKFRDRIVLLSYLNHMAGSKVRVLSWDSLFWSLSDPELFVQPSMSRLLSTPTHLLTPCWEMCIWRMSSWLTFLSLQETHTVLDKMASIHLKTQVSVWDNEKDDMSCSKELSRICEVADIYLV